MKKSNLKEVSIIRNFLRTESEELALLWIKKFPFDEKSQFFFTRVELFYFRIFSDAF